MSGKERVRNQLKGCLGSTEFPDPSLSYCQGPGHIRAQQTQLRLLQTPTDVQTNPSRMILFSLKRSINHPNPKYCACCFTI